MELEIVKLHFEPSELFEGIDDFGNTKREIVLQAEENGRVSVVQGFYFGAKGELLTTSMSDEAVEPKEEWIEREIQNVMDTYESQMPGLKVLYVYVMRRSDFPKEVAIAGAPIKLKKWKKHD